MSVCVTRASSVIVHRVPLSAVDRFRASQDEFTRAAESFAGYQGCDVYPPADAAAGDWVVIIHFDDDADLQAWLDSPIRSEIVARVRQEVGEFELKATRAGFGSWFSASPAAPTNDSLPAWKMALTVLLALYPTVMLLSLTIGRVTGPLGMAVSMLIGNALSVSILQWGVMPRLTRVCDTWLHANAATQRTKSLTGVAIIGLILGVMTIAFRQITG